VSCASSMLQPPGQLVLLRREVLRVRPVPQARPPAPVSLRLPPPNKTPTTPPAPPSGLRCDPVPAAQLVLRLSITGRPIRAAASSTGSHASLMRRAATCWPTWPRWW
jgi:hypothetical protein